MYVDTLTWMFCNSRSQFALTVRAGRDAAHLFRELKLRNVVHEHVLAILGHEVKVADGSWIAIDEAAGVGGL